MENNSFFSELAEQFPGRCELKGDVLVVQFQHAKLEYLNTVPVSVVMDGSMRCHLMTFGLGSVEDEHFADALSVCNQLNKNDFFSARFYADPETNKINAHLCFMVLPDSLFPQLYVPAVLGKFAKDVDEAFATIYRALH